jgi:hypothetical protein
MCFRPRNLCERACPNAPSAQILAVVLALAAVLALAFAPGQALAASATCPALFDLYRACHAQGVQADSGKTCLEASAEAMTRALAQSLAASPRKSPQTARALVELVCGTGCDDAVSRLPAATRQEFTEAFCD